MFVTGPFVMLMVPDPAIIPPFPFSYSPCTVMVPSIVMLLLLFLLKKSRFTTRLPVEQTLTILPLEKVRSRVVNVPHK